MVKKDSSILAKLDELERHFYELERQIADPMVAGDSTKVIALSKERGKLKAIVTKYREYKKTIADIESTREIIDSATAEEDIKELAREELGQLEDKKSGLLEEIQNAFVMADEMSINSVIMEIRAGTGGEEAALFARDLYTMYVKYADSRGWKVEQLTFNATEMGGFREIIFGVKGEGVGDLSYEGGGHRVQRVPATESQGRIHTSAATVAVLPEPEEVDIQIESGDVVEHVSRSSGPGGQSVNKLNSAVKLEHIPTGITVSMQDEKSQHKNRAKAWRILRSRLYKYYLGKERARRDRQRKSMIGSGDRSEKIRTYNYPQNRLTDHRIKLSVYSLDKIMAGDMGKVIAALKSYDREQRLKNL